MEDLLIIGDSELSFFSPDSVLGISMTRFDVLPHQEVVSFAVGIGND